MAKYNNASVVKAKNLLVCRLQYVINERLKYTSGRALSDRILIGPMIISKLKRGIGTGISFDALLEVARRLNCKVRLVIDINAMAGSDVTVQLDPLV